MSKAKDYMCKTTVFLLVEDDDHDAFFVEREFKSVPSHIKLKRVIDGMEAVQYLQGKGDYANRAKYPLPQVILLDLKMPKFTGFEFLEWLRSQSPEDVRLTPVIVMSSSNLESDVKRAYALGVNSYMVKAIDWKLFKERIKALGIYWTEHVETLAA